MTIIVFTRKTLKDFVLGIVKQLLKPKQLEIEIPQTNDTVGKSERTPGKHDFLNALLGREVGVFSLNRRQFYGNWPYVVVDLCAGDGRPNRYSNTSSPLIISKHMGFLKRKRRPHKVLLVEQNKNAFVYLSRFESEGFDTLNVNNQCKSVSDWVSDQIQSRNTPVFVHNDPNTVNDWGLSDDLVNVLGQTDLFTTFSTLGCNAGGIKRLERESRMKWFEEMCKLCSIIPAHHDAILFALTDASQWAYFVTGPKTWMDYKEGGVTYNRYVNAFESAFKYWKGGYRYARLRTDPAKFRDLVEFLFLTKEERDNASD